MKLLITGGLGQVGQELRCQSQAKGWQAQAVDRDELDITDPAAVRTMVQAYAPDAVINAAAYTAVDGAESEPDSAYAVNRDGAANLADACAELGILLVHYSTDYVFDGAKADAYIEDDPTAPLGVYGASKLAGELAVRDRCPSHLILRTSWVFSAHGQNFVKTMLSLGSARDTLQVVSDQHGKPTSAGELARLTLELLPRLDGHAGTYHAAQPHATSWHAFAQAIFAEAKKQGMELRVADVQAISTAQYPTPARRPANSVLNCALLEATFGISIRPWRESLAEVIGELNHV